MVEAEIDNQEDYEVNIGAFNGPMDLLVYLVQKKEMALDQIPIAEIADDFAKWVEAYSAMDLSKAGDFLCMASRLMALKVQELLPAEERDPELEEAYNEDREQLMKEMLEYQRYKQVASGLQDMEANNFGTYSRGRLEKTQSDDDTLADANIWQLFRAYQKSLKTKISETIHHIELDYVTIQDRQQAINNFLSVNGRALFEELLDNDSHPIVAAVTFMAMLEMIKTDEIVFRQSELFGPIWIYRKKNNPDYAEEMAHETVFFSKDPDVKPGLVEALRSQALARSQQGNVGDIAAVMREAVLWTSRGRNVSDDDLTAMLEGREDISEVQENPFGDADDADIAKQAAANAQGSASAETSAAVEPTANAESTASAEVSEANEATGTDAASAETSAAEEQSVAQESIPAAFTADNFDETDAYTVAEGELGNDDFGNEDDIADFEDDDNDDDFEDDDENQEDGEFIDEADAGEPEYRSEPPVKNQASHTAETTITNPEEAATMNDAQFAEFMKKAQEYYNNAAAGAAFAAGTKAEEDEVREAAQMEAEEESVEMSSTASSDDWTKSLPDDWDTVVSGKWSNTSASENPPSRAEYDSGTTTAKPSDEEKNYSFGNEMTDEEYIAFLKRQSKK